MTVVNKNKSINSKYILVTLVAVTVSWVLHEFAHWIAGRLLGYEMGMTLNKSFPVDGKYGSGRDYQLISAAGPAFTLIEAIFVFIMMRRKKMTGLYPFLFTCFYMR